MQIYMTKILQNDEKRVTWGRPYHIMRKAGYGIQKRKAPAVNRSLKKQCIRLCISGFAVGETITFPPSWAFFSDPGGCA